MTNFAFSVEEIYQMFGRYDNSFSIDFHPNSESATKYGRSIMGVPIYNRREREDIEKLLKKTEIPRTNSYVRFDVSELCKLSEEKIEQLRVTGFLSGDIFTINHIPLNFNDSYNQKEGKEIPGTINIKVPIDEGFNPELLALMLYRNRIEDNSKPLIGQEWNEYYAYKILYQNDKITDDEWKEIFEQDSKHIKEEVRFYIIRSKMRRDIQLTFEEVKDLKEIFERRRAERYGMVDKEISKSAGKKLKKIIDSDNELYMEIKREALFFETMNLSPYDSTIPVWLDLERYLHIFVRHCEDFQIGDWKNGGKSAFPYSFKDVKRLLKLAIEELNPQIEDKLKVGKEFSIFDKKAFYFNGNYYVIHIDKNGRLLSFYPHKNPE